MTQFQKILAKSILIGSFFSGHVVSAAEDLAGEYAQPTGVVLQGIEDEKTCLSIGAKAHWDGETCSEKAANIMKLEKISNRVDSYLALLSIVGGKVHTCDFRGEVQIQGDELVYRGAIPHEKELCEINIRKSSTGLKVEASDSCSRFYCGQGLSLSGSDETFERQVENL